MNKFVEEVSHFIEYGLEIGGTVYTIVIRDVICDASARAFISGVPSHSSRHGCSKCTQVTYSEKSSDIISDEDFSCRKYENHHLVKYLHKKTPLENIGVNMVTQIILDVMHLIN